MAEIQIRTAVATDLPRLMEIDHSCRSDYVWQLYLQKGGEQIIATIRAVRLPRSIRVTYPRDVSALADEWSHNAMMFVAVAGNKQVGYIRIFEQTTAGAAWITDLAVSSEVRRRGTASALIQVAQEWSGTRGLRQIYLEMPSKNHVAIQLSQKMGFEFCGYNDHYYATQDVALFFGRTLK